jgi:hypothetical protein
MLLLLLLRLRTTYASVSSLAMRWASSLGTAVSRMYDLPRQQQQQHQTGQQA